MVEWIGATSGLLIAVVGGIFTYLYNRRQLDLVQQRDRESERLHLLEATEKMIPHLSGPTKEVALVALSNLASSGKLVISLAELYPGRAASVACLEILDKQPPEVRNLELVRRPLFFSLYYAAGQKGELGVIELLDERMEKEEFLEILNATDSQGRTAMMNAARNNRGGNIRRLARLGARLEVTDRGGETAFHHAARYGNRNATIALVYVVQEKLAQGVWTLGQAEELLDGRNSRNRWTAAELADYHGSRPENQDRSREYSAVARRLRMVRATLGD